MRKFILVFMAVCVCFSFGVSTVFAKGDKPEEKATTGKKFDGVTLKIFANSHAPMLKAVQWSVDVVKEKYGITLLMDEAAYGVQLQKVTDAFVSGAAQYDIIDGAHQWTGGWYEAGYIEALDPFIAKDPDFDKSIYVDKAYKINSTFAGKQVGLPFNMEGRLMFYRKDIFEKEGLKVPTNLKEWVEVVKYFDANRSKYPDGFYGAVYMYAVEQGAAYPVEQYWGLFDWDRFNTSNGFWDDNFQNIMDEDLLTESFKFWAYDCHDRSLAPDPLRYASRPGQRRDKKKYRSSQHRLRSAYVGRLGFDHGFLE
jgi:ABC-type glycerol-3-phosphate transport system substrate-binding protein